MNPKKLAALLAALALLVFAASGCGGEGGSAAGDGSTAAVETNPSGSDETSSTGDDGPLLGGECKEFVDLAADMEQAFSSSAGGLGNIGQAKEIMDRIAERVPDEIKEDFEVVADAFGKMAEALDGVDLSTASTDPSVLQKLQDALASVDQAKVDAASKNIDAWTKANC